MDLSTLLAGLVAYGIAVLASALLVFATYRVNTILTRKIDEERMLLAGHRSIAIALGAVVLAQALLLRHAVFPSMVVIRDLFLHRFSLLEALWVVGQCALFFTAISLLSFGSVAIAAWLFSRMTRELPEREEILRDNVAVAVFFAFVVLAITAILNEGLEDLSRSLIPHASTGILRLS
jgi:hypothetical protein